MLFNPDLVSSQAAIEQATMLNHQYTNGNVSMDGVEDLSMKSNRNSSSDTLSKPESPSRWADKAYINLTHYLNISKCSNTVCPSAFGSVSQCQSHALSHFLAMFQHTVFQYCWSCCYSISQCHTLSQHHIVRMFLLEKRTQDKHILVFKKISEIYILIDKKARIQSNLL